MSKDETKDTLSALPFDMPPLSTLRQSPKKVFAHYFTPYPLSIDNHNPQTDYYQNGYLSPEGENGKHRAYGGFLRQRPLPRAPLGDTWVEDDLKTEVRRAVAIGLDGFTCDLLSSQGVQWKRILGLMDAAQAVDRGFKVVLMPDMNAGAFATTDDSNLTQTIAELSRKPAAYRLDDGRLVVSPFNAHKQSAQWWAKWLEKMAAPPYNTRIAFVPTFQNWRAYATPGSQWAEISAGVTDWGNRAFGSNATPFWTDAAAEMHALKPGMLAMLPVAPQDFRPKNLLFWEAGNSRNYRRMWDTALQRGVVRGADWVQVITWNDYSEAAEISPSTGTQYAFYDLTAFYIAWFKTGTRPIPTRDVLYYFHRTQATTAPRDTTRQPKAFTTPPGSLPASSDEIELLAFLKPTDLGKCTLEIEVGTHVMSAAVASLTPEYKGSSIYSFRVPLTVTMQGKPIFRLKRAGTVVATVVSAFAIDNSTTYQDLLYRGGSTSRPAVDSSWFTPPAPPSSP